MNRQTVFVAGGTGLVALLIGLGIGGAAFAKEPAPVPTPTVTTTEVKTRDIPKVPEECLQALEAADTMSKAGADALTSASNVIGTIPDLIDAIVLMDSGSMDQINSIIEEENAKLDALDMKSLRQDFEAKSHSCRVAQEAMS